MNKQRRLCYVWGVLACGVLFISALPGISRLGQITAPYVANHWVRFLVYAAVASIPCAAWRTRRCALCCLLAAGFSVVCGLVHAIASRPADAMENIVPDLFGVTAGVLLGLNLRFIRNSAEADCRHDTRAASPNRILGGFLERQVRCAAGKPLFYGLDIAEMEKP